MAIKIKGVIGSVFFPNQAFKKPKWFQNFNILNPKSWTFDSWKYRFLKKSITVKLKSFRKKFEIDEIKNKSDLNLDYAKKELYFKENFDAKNI